VFLFIFESIGTQELLLIGIVALIFLGPRRMPEMARKLGKIMSDFRKTTSEFKETWEREVNFDEEQRAFRTGELSSDSTPVARENSILPTPEEREVVLPEIKAVDPAEFENRSAAAAAAAVPASNASEKKEAPDLTAKENWL
jgi:sec-independent protein translocase protein TatB